MSGAHGHGHRHGHSRLRGGDASRIITVAIEIVRTLVGSVGLVAAVPITTALATWVIADAESPEPVDVDAH